MLPDLRELVRPDEGVLTPRFPGDTGPLVTVTNQRAFYEGWLELVSSPAGEHLPTAVPV